MKVRIKHVCPVHGEIRNDLVEVRNNGSLMVNGNVIEYVATKYLQVTMIVEDPSPTPPPKKVTWVGFAFFGRFLGNRYDEKVAELNARIENLHDMLNEKEKLVDQYRDRELANIEYLKNRSRYEFMLSAAEENITRRNPNDFPEPGSIVIGLIEHTEDHGRMVLIIEVAEDDHGRKYWRNPKEFTPLGADGR